MTEGQFFLCKLSSCHDYIDNRGFHVKLQKRIGGFCIIRVILNRICRELPIRNCLLASEWARLRALQGNRMISDYEKIINEQEAKCDRIV